MKRFIFALALLAAPYLVQAQSTINLALTTSASQDSGLQWQLAKRTEPQANGTGYAVGNILTAIGGTCATPMTFTVTAVGGNGGVQSIALRNSGVCTVIPTTPAATTVSPSGGTGATLKIAFPSVAAMLTDNFNKAIGDYRRQWKDEQRQTISNAVEAANNAQMNNAASALGIVLP